MKRTGRVWAFLLGVLVGILALVGGVVGGGLWAYNYLKPSDVGITIPGAGGTEGNLNNMSIKALTEQLMRIYGKNSTYTIDEFESDFGVDVSQLLGIQLNSDIKKSPLLVVLSENGLSKLLSSTKMGAVLGFVPGLFGQEVYDEISKFNISDLFNAQSGGISNVLGGVKIGGLLSGYTYDPISKTYSNTSGSKSIMNSFANVKIGGALNVFTTGQNIFEQIKSTTGVFYTVGETQLSSLIGGMDNILGTKTLADMIDNNYKIAPLAILDGLYIGNVLNYSKGECNNNTTHIHNADCKYNWYIEENKQTRVDKLMEVFSNSKIDDILKGEFNIANLFTDLKIGDLMSYTLECIDKSPDHIIHDEHCVNKWFKKGVEVDAVMNALANQAVSQLLEGIFDINSIFEGLKIGTIMGYTEKTDGWYKDNVKVDALMSSIASTNISELLDGSFNIGTALDGNYVGDLMKYTKGDCKNSTAGHSVHTIDCEYHWFKNSDKTISLTDLEESIANISVKKLMDGSFTPDDMISKLTLGSVLTIDKNSNPLLIKLKDTKISDLSTKINTLTIADVIGVELYDASRASNASELFKGKYGKYDTANVFTPDSAIINAIAGLTINNINGDTLQTAINNLSLGDVLNLENASGILGQLKDTKISNLTTAINDIKLGYAIGLYFNNGKWYTNSNFTTEASGINAKLADLTIRELSTEGMLQGKIETLTLKDVGITATSGILKQLEDTQIKDLSTKIDTIQLGHLLGLTLTDTGWKDSNGNAATGLNATLADITIQDISTGGLTAKINTMKLGDLVDIGANPTGILKLLKDTPINGIADKIKTIKMGDVMNLYYDTATSKWYNDTGFTSEATGITAALADMNINEISGDQIMGKVKGLKVSDIFPERNGFMALIPEDTKINDLPAAMSKSIQIATINDLLINGVLTFDTKTIAGLDLMFSKDVVLNSNTVKEWRTFTITNLLTKLIDRATLMTNFIANTTKIAELSLDPVTNATEITRLQNLNATILATLNGTT